MTKGDQARLTAWTADRIADDIHLFKRETA
jgi:hypothetical protein